MFVCMYFFGFFQVTNIFSEVFRNRALRGITVVAKIGMVCEKVQFGEVRPT